MENVQQTLQTVLQSYGFGDPQCVESLGGAGGFSGAQFWRVSLGEAGVFCLRKWPLGSDPSRIRWIHGIVMAAAADGCPWLACPRQTAVGETVACQQQAWFELAPWMPGTADFHTQPSTRRLQQALRALAHFHLASARSVMTAADVSPAVQSRIQRIQQLRAGLAQEITARLKMGHPWVDPGLARRMVDLFDQQGAPLEQALAAFRGGATLVPCLRDIWHDHVLFTGDEVSGIVDYDALRLDTVVTDIGRLVGSLVRGDRSRWQMALDAYHEVAPLDDRQRELAVLLDASNVVLAGMQWLEWLFVREIEFENAGNVQRRLGEISLRLNEWDFQM